MESRGRGGGGARARGEDGLVAFAIAFASSLIGGAANVGRKRRLADAGQELVDAFAIEDAPFLEEDDRERRLLSPDEPHAHSLIAFEDDLGPHASGFPRSKERLPRAGLIRVRFDGEKLRLASARAARAHSGWDHACASDYHEVGRR